MAASAVREAFGDSASRGVIVKTYSATNLAKDAVARYSPAAVAAVSREVVSGDPDQYVSTSYFERQNLSLRMGSRRFIRLTNGFSKKLDDHVAGVRDHCSPIAKHHTSSFNAALSCQENLNAVFFECRCHRRCNRGDGFCRQC